MAAGMAIICPSRVLSTLAPLPSFTPAISAARSELPLAADSCAARSRRSSARESAGQVESWG